MSARRAVLRAFLGIFVAALLVLPAIAAADPALPPGFQDEAVFSNLEQPTNFRFAPDGRVFVAEKPGRILVYENVEDTTPEVFAELSGDVYDNGDRGLLGLALDPSLENGRPYVYALYTWDHVLGEAWDPAHPKYGTPGVFGDPGCPTQNSSASCLVSGRLVRLTASVSNRNKAVEEGGRPKEEQLLGGWCQQFSSHSIGELKFGPEEALYVSGGDGASYESIPDWGQLGTGTGPGGYVNACGDPPTPKGTVPPQAESQGGALRAQNLNLLNGAILRINPDTGKAFPGNPLAAESNENAQRTIAKGFRNPFRFTLDQGTGELYSGNVGSSEIEEIDRFAIPPTSLYNSGWPCYEGPGRQFQFSQLGLNVCNALYAGEPNLTSEPFFSYSHGQTVVPDDQCPVASGSAIGGISFYRGSQFPASYKGALFFADAVRGCIWVMRAGADGRPDPSTTERFLREGKIYPGVEISEGPDGYLYYADLFGEEGLGKGSIHRVVYKPTAPTARLEAKPPFGLYAAGKFKTVLDASASTDPQGQPLTYEWNLDESGNFKPGPSQQELTFTEAEQQTRESKDESPNRVIGVRVRDSEGLVSVARTTVYPGDKPPVVSITAPLSTFKWAVGDKINFQGSAVDAKGKPIETPLSYAWTTRLAHCPNLSEPTACHVHPLQTFAGTRTPSLVAPQHDYPSYIEAILRVSDGRELSGTAVLNIFPETVTVSLASDPPGIQISAAANEFTAPFSIQSIVGSEIQLLAPEKALLGGTTYRFLGWSDGRAREHPVLTKEDVGFTARFEAVPEETKGGGSGETGGGQAEPPKQPPVTATPLAPKLSAKPPKRTTKRVAKFAFATKGASRFQCRLDKKKFASCRSPKTYRGLAPGAHAFRVRAVAADGSPLTKATLCSWKIVGG